jgi:hypothetical protein
MGTNNAVGHLLALLEDDIPLTEAKLRSHLHVTFKVKRDGLGRKVLVAASILPNADGVMVTAVEFRPAGADFKGDLVIALSNSGVPSSTVAKRFPGGSWLPPTPPAKQAEADYWVERPWGSFFFGFSHGALQLVRFNFGQHASPGI